jgi:hypothetical protein
MTCLTIIFVGCVVAACLTAVIMGAFLHASRRWED